MTQTARPNGTTSNAWTLNPASGTAHEKINDQSDSTFLSMAGGVDGLSYGTLPSLADPVVHTGHVINGRVNRFAGTGNTTLSLYQGNPGSGGTLIASLTLSGTSGIENQQYTLSTGEAANITNYTALYWHLDKTTGTHAVSVYEYWLEVPSAPVIVTPSTVGATASVPTPTVIATSANATATPSTVAAMAAVLPPVVVVAGEGMPRVFVEADFTTPPLSIPTDWTDISSRHRSSSIHQGRQRVLQKTEVGSATVLLDNRDRTFDPTVNPNVRPANHLRIQAVRNGVTYDLFRGFVRSWPQEWPQKKDAVSQVQAEDLFALLARYELEGDAIAEMGTGAHLEEVLNRYGWPVFGSVPPGETWWKLGTVGASELGTNTYLGETLRFLDDGNATIMATTLEGNLLEHLLNVAETTEGGIFYISPSGEVTFTERPSPFEPSTGTWGDTEGEFRYVELSMSYDDEQIFNDVRITRRGDTEPFTATDATSVTNYGPRTLIQNDTLFSTEQQAQDSANNLLSRYNDPFLHPTQMVMRPKPDSPLWSQILGARLGKKITVRRRPPGGGAMIELECTVLGISYEINPSFWEITWDIAPTEQILEGYWYLGATGRSELGTTTKLA